MDPDAPGPAGHPVFPFLSVEDPFSRIWLIKAANLVVERGRVNVDKPLVNLTTLGTGNNVPDVFNGLPVVWLVARRRRCVTGWGRTYEALIVKDRFTAFVHSSISLSSFAAFSALNGHARVARQSLAFSRFETVRPAAAAGNAGRSPSNSVTA
jgi:hypothetical protein